MNPFKSWIFSLTAAVAFAPSVATAGEGPFAPRAGQPGSTAVRIADPRIVAWADRFVDVEWGEDLSEEWNDVSRALGPASGDIMHVVSLGRGGRLTLEMALPIIDRTGADFVVFGNSHSDYFLELAFVEVSSDGIHFVRFPNTSLTAEPVPAFGRVDPTQVDGFAGKYRVGWGVPFDLSALHGVAGSEHLDFENIRFVRLIDVVGGSDSALTQLPQSRDSEGRLVYDPFPTVGSAGFDLDGIGVLHSELRAEPDSDGILLRWRAQPGASTRLLRSSDLREWVESAVLPAAETPLRELHLPIGDEGRVFYSIGQQW